MNKKNVARSLSASVVALATTAIFADPFSGVIIEGALGASQLKSEAWSVQSVIGASGVISQVNPVNKTNFAGISFDAPKESQFAQRLGVGYAYTLPIINLNLAGLLTYNVGQQKLKGSNGIATGDLSSQPDLSGWTAELKNSYELRLQPGYYIFPLRVLVYGTLGYARAKLDVSGKNLNLNSTNNANGSTLNPVGQGNVNLNGSVLGLGAKFSPIPLLPLYVGIDYSHTSYNSKKISGQTQGDATARQNGFFPVSWERETGKINVNTYLVTLGYYF